jgi:biotin synthase-related radical SAM superfamily protein
MPNFASAVQKAIKNVASIQGFGQDVTIRTITAGSYNTTTGDVTTKPTTKDKVLISSIVHNIIRVLTKTSGGTDISYTLYLRT